MNPLDEWIADQKKLPKQLQARIKFLECQVKQWELQYAMLRSMYVDEKAMNEYVKSKEFKAIKSKEIKPNTLP